MGHYLVWNYSLDCRNPNNLAIIDDEVSEDEACRQTYVLQVMQALAINVENDCKLTGGYYSKKR